MPRHQKLVRLEIESCDDVNVEAPSGPPKRRCKGTREAKDKRQFLRNSGQEYVDSNGKVKQARSMKPVHTCVRLKCQDNISEDIAKTLFQEYWDLQSYDSRLNYVTSRMEVTPVKRKRSRLPEEESHSKSTTNKYYFDVFGKRMQVCKSTFLGTLGETDGFIRNAASKKNITVSGVPPKDARGRHPPKHKLPASVEDAVRKYILSYPSYISHYKRNDVGDVRFLPSDLSVTKLHEEYCGQEGANKVCFSTFEKIFKTCGRKFKQPSTDTCSKCDEYKVQLQYLTGEEREEILKIRDVHHERAEVLYQMKRDAKEQAGNDPSKRVLMFDLEQCLETPYLKCGKVFYLRQLYTFNLTVLDTTTNVTHCYMWHEGEGERGANQIGSCLLNHILNEIPGGVTDAKFFSDSTSGQNRNSHIAAMFLTALEEHCSLKTITHICLEVGHTRLEVDCKHAAIEGLKNSQKIEVPSDWYTAISKLNENAENPKFVVHEMKQGFYNFAQLLKGPLVLRSVCNTGAKFYWMKTHYFQYRKNNRKIFFKEDVIGPNSPFLSVDFRRNRKNNSDGSLAEYLEYCYKGPLPISEEKKGDLLKLLPFIKPLNRQFFQNLITSSGADDVDPDIPGDEMEEEGEEISED